LDLQIVKKDHSLEVCIIYWGTTMSLSKQT